MLAYIQQFVIEHRFGYGYLFTNVMLVLGAVILLRDFPAGKRRGWLFAAECAVSCVVYMLMDSLYFWAFGHWQMDRIVISLFVLFYAVLRSQYDFRVCLVRGWMYIATVMVMLPISEPLGDLFRSIREEFMAWSQYLTPLAMALMVLSEVLFLRHFSFDTGTTIGVKYVWMQFVISLITILIEGCAELTGAAQAVKGFNVLICICLWFINLMAYYLFYSIDQATKENISLNALRQKAELETEKFHTTKLNYEELRTIRHEIKNHNFYIKALLDEGKIPEAREYLDRVSAKGTKYLKSFDSGNYVIDIVMNHEIAAAKEWNVTLKESILVPKQLPFRDEDLCSLLSNLLDNALEAAAQSGEKAPAVEISILPRQEYLFIRVTNPVDKALPEHRRMTLETTKTKHTELHGFGTRIIRSIAETYNGSVKYSMSGGLFTTDVMLEMPENGEEKQA